MNMKYLAIALAICFAAGSVRGEDKKELKDPKEKTSYGLGFNIGTNLKRQGAEATDFDFNVLVNAIQEAMAGKESILNPQETRETMTSFNSTNQVRREQKRKQLAEKNKKEGDAFLAENKSKPGVTTLPNGLQYKILTEGHGPKPTTNDTVTVNYRGTLINGTEFDSSAKRGPFTTRVAGGIIKGWTEALQLMPTGSKWQLFIPPALAYGERGYGNIEPDATLIFEIELISIKAPESAGASTVIQQPVTSDIIKVPSAEELKKGAKIEIIKPDQIEKEKEKERQQQKK